MSDEAGQLSTCEKGLAELSKWISPESPTDRRSSVLVSQSLAVCKHVFVALNVQGRTTGSKKMIL